MQTIDGYDVHCLSNAIGIHQYKAKAEVVSNHKAILTASGLRKGIVKPNALYQSPTIHAVTTTVI